MEFFNQHIILTRIVAHHEYHHAYHEKDYASACEWSILWFRCLMGPIVRTNNSINTKRRFPHEN
jgi:hypothetical protein